jgi:DUF3037 family protein
VYALNSYDYALIRLVPNVERGECLNVGILLFCRTRSFLGMRVHLDTRRILVLAPDLDIDSAQQQLDAMLRICAGSSEAGSLGSMSQSERFHWLTSPRSTILQPSPVHSGLCSDPEMVLESLLKKMVFLPASSNS